MEGYVIKINGKYLKHYWTQYGKIVDLDLTDNLDTVDTYKIRALAQATLNSILGMSKKNTIESAQVVKVKQIWVEVDE